MSVKAANRKRAEAYVKLLQNPYASLSICEDPAEEIPGNTTGLKHAARLKDLQNPYAYLNLFGEPEINEAKRKVLEQTVINFPEKSVALPEPTRQKANSDPNLELTLNEMLKLYKPYVARSEWAQVLEYRPRFLDAARGASSNPGIVIERLRKLMFSLMPNEKVENNRAPAKRIIAELEKLLI